jgi:hypothetical protein
VAPAVGPVVEWIRVLRYFRGRGSLVDLAGLAEFSFSDLVQQPTRVASAVEERGRVVLRRRNKPDLVLSRASDLTELAGFARLLSRMVTHLQPAELAETVAEALPWTRYLNDPERTEFVKDLPAVIQDCEDLGTFVPLEVYLTQWRETAAILADPELADRLTSPIKKPLGKRVSPP